MKTKFKANAPPADKQGEFFSHVQDLTDSLGSVIAGGLSMKDGSPRPGKRGAPFNRRRREASSNR